MPGFTRDLAAMLRRLRGVAALRSPDADLLQRFADNRDEVAFEAIIARHGPMVLGVCRAILSDGTDVEDAFQATFLVLVSRAGDVRDRDALGCWLYGVATRTARKARDRARRRWRVEAAAPAPVELQPLNPSWSEVQNILRSELARLGERYRLPLELCFLHGQTQDEAAGLLGVSKATVRRRLERGRSLLRARLVRRGLGPGTVLLASAWPAVAWPATVPPTLMQTTAAAAARLAAGGTASAVVSASAACLTHGVLRAMLFTRLKLTALAVLVAAPVLLVLGLAGMQLVGGDEPAKGGAAGAPAGPAWKERVVLTHQGQLIHSVAFSPDGKAVAIGGTGGKVSSYDAVTFQRQWETKLDGNFAAVAYSADGKTLGATFKDGVQFLDAASGKAGDALEAKDSNPIAVAFFPDKPLDEAGIQAVSRKVVFGNSRGYFVKEWLEWPKVGTIELRNVPPGKEPVDRYAVPVAVDPARRSVVITGPIDRDTGKNVLWAYVAGDYGKGSPGNRLLTGHGAPVTSAAWSKDGNMVLTGDRAGVVIVWDAATMKEKSRVEFNGQVVAVAVTADGARSAVAVASVAPGGTTGPAYRESVHVWETSEGERKAMVLSTASNKPLGGPFVGLAALAFSPDGKSLAAAFCNSEHLKDVGEVAGKVHVWEVGTINRDPRP